MKSCFFIFLLFLAPFLARAEHRPLLPSPQVIRYGEGYFSLKGASIHFGQKPSAADTFAAHCLDGLGLDLKIGNGHSSKHAILLKYSQTNIASTPEDEHSTLSESYTIHITKEGVEINAYGSSGLFYGMQTLVQMVEWTNGGAVLPVADLEDSPKLPNRGFMMDFSHGQVLRVSEIKKQLDLLAKFKANQYYFYSEMNIAWDGYNVLPPDAQFTQENIRDIIDYARTRHIDVIPCVELYGHMHDLFRAEKFADLGLPRYGDEFDPRNPRALETIDHLLDQTMALFPSKWIHVGFDEPWSLGKIGTTPGQDPFQKFVEVLQHVAKRADDHGKRLMYWADLQASTSTLSSHPELLKHLPGNAIAVPWKYEAETNYAPFVDPLSSNGLATVVAPAIWNWNEIFPDYHRTFININGLTAAGVQRKTLGILNTGWTDCAQTLYRESWPGIAFGAAAGWQAGLVDTNTFFKDYCTLMYRAHTVEDVTAAYEELSTVEEMFENILGNTTQHGFWNDPLAPRRLNRLKEHAQECHQARLLAEEAIQHLQRAKNETPHELTLDSMLMAARLFDYLGMKSLYAIEWDHYFTELKTNADPKLITLYIGIQINAQDHGMLADLTDTITGLREPYRQAWLAESTPYRLGTALARWDAEAQFWLATWERVENILRTHKNGEPFPSIDVIRAKP